MRYTIYSKTRRAKRWKPHIPSDSKKETAERRLAELSHHGRLNPKREYMVAKYPLDQR